jgi:hypothetical protein
MQIGNRKELDAAREAMRDAFDAIWLASDKIGHKESRAIKCALALDKPRLDSGYNWRIFPGGCGTPSGDIVWRGRACYPVIYA